MYHHLYKQSNNGLDVQVYTGDNVDDMVANMRKLGAVASVEDLRALDAFLRLVDQVHVYLIYTRFDELDDEQKQMVSAGAGR